MYFVAHTFRLLTWLYIFNDVGQLQTRNSKQHTSPICCRSYLWSSNSWASLLAFKNYLKRNWYKLKIDIEFCLFNIFKVFSELILFNSVITDQSPLWACVYCVWYVWTSIKAAVRRKSKHIMLKFQKTCTYHFCSADVTNSNVLE